MTRSALAFVLALTTIPGAAAADDRPVCTETPSDEEVQARLRILEGHVRDEEPGERRWFTTFLLLHGTMAAAGSILAASADTNEGMQVDMTVNTISSVLAAITLLTSIPPLIGAGGSLDEMPEETPEDRLRKLRNAEDILRRANNAAEFVHSWLPATGSALYTTAAATTLLVGFDRLSAAYTHIIGGAVLGLGRLLFRPVGARSRWRRYRRQYPDAACEEGVAAGLDGPTVRVGMSGLGLSFSLSF